MLSRSKNTLKQKRYGQKSDLIGRQITPPRLLRLPKKPADLFNFPVADFRSTLFKTGLKPRAIHVNPFGIWCSSLPILHCTRSLTVSVSSASRAIKQGKRSFRRTQQVAAFSLQHAQTGHEPIFGLAVACADRVQPWMRMRGPSGPGGQAFNA